MAKKDVVRVSLEANRGYHDPTGIDRFQQDKFVLNYRCDNAVGGHEENDILITRYSDGSISFSEADTAEDFIYLYPQQIKHLKKILSMRPPIKFGGTKKAHKFQETARQTE